MQQAPAATPKRSTMTSRFPEPLLRRGGCCRRQMKNSIGPPHWPQSAHGGVGQQRASTHDALVDARFSTVCLMPATRPWPSNGCMRLSAQPSLAAASRSRCAKEPLLHGETVLSPTTMELLTHGAPLLPATTPCATRPVRRTLTAPLPAVTSLCPAVQPMCRRRPSVRCRWGRQMSRHLPTPSASTTGVPPLVLPLAPLFLG